MNPEKLPQKYCFDTSAFIDSWRRFYSPKVFPELWEKLADMMKSGEIIVPREVMNELNSPKDDLWLWFKKNKECVVEYSAEHITFVQGVLTKYPKVSQYHKTRPYHADPFVVAVGKIENRIVVTWEGVNGSGDNPSVPSLCKEYGINWMNPMTFLEEKGWIFKLK